ncbi:hypothetical protein NDU88_004736 [Pleurodeles waltl]|uniref:Uncharacterized protein n=1 Tax=Pleurodeles waltl TaxID=8319 RepID=A0AAV7W5U0_PLEWA|nr:hypothetical protein NDU88_004736 [Pleurodeles waltl]
MHGGQPHCQTEPVRVRRIAAGGGRSPTLVCRLPLVVVSAGGTATPLEANVSTDAGTRAHQETIAFYRAGGRALWCTSVELVWPMWELLVSCLINMSAALILTSVTSPKHGMARRGEASVATITAAHVYCFQILYQVHFVEKAEHRRGRKRAVKQDGRTYVRLLRSPAQIHQSPTPEASYTPLHWTPRGAGTAREILLTRIATQGILNPQFNSIGPDDSHGALGLKWRPGERRDRMIGPSAQ